MRPTRLTSAGWIERAGRSAHATPQTTGDHAEVVGNIFFSSFPRNVSLPPSGFMARVNNSDCDIGADGYEMTSHDVDGRTISLQLCFKAQSFPENRRLVAYRTDDKGVTWGNGPYSDEVQAYINARSAEFALSEVDRQAALNEWRSKRLSAAWYGFLFAVGGWIALSIIQSVIGWIVRGFAGIPMGVDRRPEPPASE